MPWVFLGKKPSCDRKMHNLIPYSPCLWSDAQGSASPRAGPVRSLLLVPPAQQDEGGMNKPTSPDLCGHCQGRGKVREAKRWIFEEFQVRNQTGKTQSFCPLALCSDRKPARNWLHVQNERKPVKTNFKQKGNCQNLKGSCLSPKSFCLAWLPCCSAQRARKSSSPSCCRDCHRQEKGSLAKAANCAVSSPHLLRPPGCTLRRNAPQADRHRFSDVLCCQRAPGVSVPCPSPHTLGSPSSLTRNFVKKLLSPSRKSPHRADSGLTPHTSLPSQATKQFVPSLSHLKFQEPDCTSHTWISFPLWHYSTTVTHCHIPPRNVTETPFLTLLLTCSSQISSLVPCSPTGRARWGLWMTIQRARDKIYLLAHQGKIHYS